MDAWVQVISTGSEMQREVDRGGPVFPGIPGDHMNGKV